MCRRGDVNDVIIVQVENFIIRGCHWGIPGWLLFQYYTYIMVDTGDVNDTSPCCCTCDLGGAGIEMATAGARLFNVNKTRIELQIQHLPEVQFSLPIFFCYTEVRKIANLSGAIYFTNFCLSFCYKQLNAQNRSFVMCEDIYYIYIFELLAHGKGGEGMGGDEGFEVSLSILPEELYIQFVGASVRVFLKQGAE